MLRLLIEWATTGRFPREEFEFNPRRFAVLLAVYVGGFALLLVLLVVALQLGLLPDD